MLKWYTYVLTDPQNDLPFYVGKGNGKRMYDHRGSHNNRYMRERILAIEAAGLKVLHEKWFESEDEDFCYWMENYLIDYFGQENLCNLGRGGEGPPSGENHPCKDPKVRAKISQTKKGNCPSGDLHPTKRPEVAARISASKRGKARPDMIGKCPTNSFQKGYTPWNKGKTGWTNSGSFQLGHVNSIEVREKASAALKGRRPGHCFPNGNVPWNKGKICPQLGVKGRVAWNKGRFGKDSPNFGKKYKIKA